MPKQIVKKVLKKIIPQSLRARYREKPLTPKLHLGCGGVILPGWTNVDALLSRGVDHVADIRKLSRVPNDFAEEIYACHVLEHFSHEEAVSVLKRWFEVLKPGGTIRISVPDLDKIVSIYHDRWDHFQTKGNTPWIGLIYGGQTTPYDFHKTGFNFNWLALLLEQQGFTNIREYPNEPHFIEGVIDSSTDKKTFDRYISLNVMAKKSV